MRPGTFPVRALVFAAYILAAILPLLAVIAGLPQTDGQHARMMAAAGHTMPMQDTAPDGDDTGMLLCQQHCLQTAATLPTQGSAAEDGVMMSVVVAAADRMPASVAPPPPGPPPKAALI